MIRSIHKSCIRQRHAQTPVIVRLATLWRLAGTITVVLLLGGVGPATAGGDAEAGFSKSTTCAACHGTKGQSDVAPTNPILAGQYESYLVNALQSYRSGARQNAIMNGFAATLSDQDIVDLAAYFSAQEGSLQTARSNR
jgi:cytochrome c553